MALDLKDPAAQDIVRRLADESDVLVENFRPGALEGYGLDPALLMERNPRLIVLRISGYGQTGPYRDKPGFGVVAEAMGGLRHLTAEPGRTPVRVGVSIGDTLAGLHGVIGVLMALHERQRSGRGQVIDVALYEAVFNCMESLLPEYSAFGAVREPAGSALAGHRAQQRLPLQRRLCADRRQRRQHLQAPDGAPSAATTWARDPATGRQHRPRGSGCSRSTPPSAPGPPPAAVAQVLAALDAAAVPAGRIYTVADIAADPHYQARGMLDTVTLADGSTLAVPGIVPKLSRTPGRHRRVAPGVGQDTQAVLQELPPTRAD